MKNKICLFVYGRCDIAKLLGRAGAIPSVSEVIHAETFSALGVHRRTLEFWGQKGAKLIAVSAGEPILHPSIIDMAEQLSMKIMAVPPMEPVSGEYGVKIPADLPVTCFNLPTISKSGMTNENRLQCFGLFIEEVHSKWHSFSPGVVEDIELL